MEDAHERLQRERDEILKEITALEAFRRGTVSIIYRRCGKQKCWCAREGSKGHGPQFIWNGTVGGKSFARNLHLGPEVEKYMQETEGYRRFLGLCERLAEVNEKICDVTPVREMENEKELEELKQKLQRRLLRNRGRR